MKKFNYKMNHKADEELEISKKIHCPMLWGSILSWLAAIVVFLISVRVSAWFAVLCVLLIVCAVMCTCLGISYARLVKRLRRARL